ncbi:MAG: HEAT repeat domain-containing protein [Fimbriimonadaceae bacterium]
MAGSGVMRLRAGLAGFVALGLGLAASASAQLTDRERQGVADTLYLANMTLADLEFERKLFRDPYRLPLVDLCLDKPLEAADALMALHATGSRSVSAMLSALRIRALGDPEERLIAPDPIRTDAPSNLPPVLVGPVMRLVGAIELANLSVRQATQALTADERRELIESLPGWAVEDRSVAFDFVRRRPSEPSRLLALLAKVDLVRIRRAAEILAISVEQEIPNLKRAAAQARNFRTVARFEIAGMPIVVAGHGPDLHTDRDAVLTIDLGGNDRYVGRHGAAAGYVSVLIDLEGDDTYDVPDLSVGAGILGIGLAYDLGGNDTYRGGSLCFGAGLAGVGILVDEAGDDDYRSATLTQGFGQFGIGMLVDKSGNDRYDAQLFAQGAARTQGAGWLVDRSGNDVYRAGGRFLNSPLFRDVHYSFAQGFSSGYREDTGGLSGGVGLLTDLAGDDAYLVETYGIAASYWFSVGSLYDGSGNDTYRGHHYAMASAMHMTAAYLFDLDGDDVYSQAFGAAHAIGHDYGVAFLLDRAGNDVYSGRDSRPGIGTANGLGIFVDGGGDDRYFGPPAGGAAARGSGSLGIFVDLGGNDRYAEGLADGSARVGETWAVAYDAPNQPVAVAGAPAAPTRPAPIVGSLPLPPDREMEIIYARATQWGVGTAQEEVAANLDRLVGIGMPAVRWMIDRKLPTVNRLSQRAFVHVVRAVGPEAQTAIALKAGDPDDHIARIALGICVDAGIVDAGALIPGLLKRPALQRTAARAAGVLQARAAIPDLLPLVLSEDRITALNAMVSLAAMPDMQSLGTAQAMLGSGDLPMRKAAVQLIARMPDQALAIGRGLLAEGDERRARIGVEVLSAVGSPEALRLIGEALSDTRPGVRIQALWALDGRCPPEFRAALLGLRQDRNPLVQTAAQRIDPGR